MIKLITRERYYKLLGIEGSDYKDYQVFQGVILPKDKWEKFCNISNSSCIYFYLEEDKICFIYINSLKVLLIPRLYKESDEICKKILSSDTTLGNWKVELLRKVDQGKHRNYLLNTFKLGNFSGSLRKFDNKDGDSTIKDSVYISGEYRITNNDFPEDSIEFSLTNNLMDSYSYWKSTYIAFPGKSELMDTDKNKVINIENLVATILNEYGRDYQESYIESK